jgi:hypothetical protein
MIGLCYFYFFPSVLFLARQIPLQLVSVYHFVL